MIPDARKLHFVIDAPGVNPDTVDPVLASGLAHEWFKAVLAVADHMAAELRFSGFHVSKGSFDIATAVSNPTIARVADAKFHKYLSGEEPTPAVLEKPVAGTRRWLRLVPSGYVVKTIVGRKPPRPVRVAAEESALSWASVTTLRVQVRDIHGGETPSVRFISPSEVAAFTVKATKDQVIALGQRLYTPLDVRVRIQRDSPHAIDPRHSTLLEIIPLGAENPTAAWREWLRKSAPEWNEIADVEGELGREAD